MSNQKRQWDLGDLIIAGSAGLIGLHILGSVAFPKAKAVFETVGSAVSTTLEIGAASAAIGGPLYLGYRVAAARKAQTEVEVIRVLPRVGMKFDASAVRQLVNQLAGLRQSRLHQLIRGREWMRFLIVREAEGIAFYIITPKNRTRAAVAAWASVYPDAEFFEVEIPELYGHQTYAIPLMRGPLAGLPFRDISSINREAPSPLISVMAHMRTEGSWVEVSFSPGSWRKLQRQAKQTVKAVGPWTDNPDSKARQKATFGRFTGRETPLDVIVTLGSPDLGELQSMAGGLAAAFSADNRVGFRAPWPLENSIPFPVPGRQFLLTSEEAGCLIHLPPEHPAAADVIRLEEGERSLEPDELAEGIAVGKLKHPIQESRPVAIPWEQFTKHFFLSGKIGSGKSSTAVMMVQSMIDAWLEDPDNAPGFTYVDPARETVAIILSRLLKAEAEGKRVPWEKVHYFYLGPTDHPVGLNLLHRDGRPQDVIAKEAASLIRFAYSSQAPKMERVLENALLTLMEDGRPHTILGIVPLLMDETFQMRIIPKVSDPVIREFWEFWEAEKNKASALDSLLNRLSPLRTNPTMRRMFGQSRWGLDIRRYMDQGHIVLFDLLNVAPEDVKLAVGGIINQYHIQAKRRSSGSKLHVMFVDEAHLVQIPVMSKIIAEDRKFGLCLGLITQYLGQFEQWLVDSITENMGTILSCSQGEQSAARIEKMTNGAFSRGMLQDLPERTVAVYTSVKVDGRSTPITCLVESEPPVIYLPDGRPADHKNRFQMERAINAALEKGRALQARDGMPADQIDREIEAYLRPKTILREVKTKETTNPNEFW